jgi:hypothetical protein
MENGMILQDLLHKAMNDCDFRTKELRVKIVELSNEINAIVTERSNLLAELQRLCTHDKTDKRTEGYMPGGYDHVSENTYIIYCTNCDKVLKSETVRGYYA